MNLWFITVPLLSWFALFFPFFQGKNPLVADAGPYCYHINFFTDNLLRGVLPFWDPLWSYGVPYEFFLRRIGDLNPFYLWIAGLKLAGVPGLQAYMMFVALYYVLAVLGFLSLARIVIKDGTASFLAFLLLLFSSWSGQLFYNYILILLTPTIWFFLFLFRFREDQCRRNFLGMTFCGVLLGTTYIPFFFITVLLAAFLVSATMMPGEVCGLWRGVLAFLKRDRVAFFWSALFLAGALIMAGMFYHDTRSGGISLGGRHEGIQSASVAAVSSRMAQGGDLLTHSYVDHLFRDHDQVVLGDIVIPYLFFLIFFVALAGPVSRRVVVLWVIALILLLIVMTTASPVYGWLYSHVFFLKYMRNLYYIFWIAVLPVLLLIAAEQYHLFMSVATLPGKKIVYFCWAVAAHALFAGFIFTQPGNEWGSWAAILLSLAGFGAAVFSPARRWVSLTAFFLSVLIQSVAIYTPLVARTEGSSGASSPSYRNTRFFPYQHCSGQVCSSSEVPMVGDSYFGSPYFQEISSATGADLVGYLKNNYYLVNNTALLPSGKEGLVVTAALLRQDRDLALIDVPDDLKAVGLRRFGDQGGRTAVTTSSREIEIVSSDANGFLLRTALASPKFLVINDNYAPAWKARTDGHETPLFRTNYAFKGVWVEKGQHLLSVRYRAPFRMLLRVTMILMMAGLLVFLCFPAVPLRKADE